ncbi:MAG: hypothetical protein ACJ761_06470 [Chloroflexota bacterium]
MESLPLFGTAYFGVRDPHHFRGDLRAIARAGYSWVLFPFTQDDASWERSTFRELVGAAEELGLTSVISPWGGDEFGGEGMQGRMTTVEWLARAKATGATILHIDEPRPKSMTLPRILDAWGDDAAVWLTIQPDRAWVVDHETSGRLGALGTDAYDGDLEGRVAQTQAFERQTERLDLAWVQAFRIEPGDERVVGDTVEAMAALATKVGIWGWKGSTGRGELRSGRPARVEQEVQAAMARVRSGSSSVEAA